MDWTLKIRKAASGAGRSLDPEIVEELAAHAQSAYDAACARGATIDEADAHTAELIRAWIASPDGLRRPSQRPPVVDPPRAGSRRLASLVQDLRYAIRLTSRQRGFSVAAIATMAIAIGVMTTLFSVAYGVLMRPLPWAEPDRLVRLTETHVGATRQMPFLISSLAYLPWLDSPSTIESIGAWQNGSPIVDRRQRHRSRVDGLGHAERLSAAARGAAPRPGLHARRRDRRRDLFRLLAGALRRAIPPCSARRCSINGQPYTIVGVMPADFLFPDRDTRIWRPFVDSRRSSTARAAPGSRCSARWRASTPGATPVAAAAEATSRAQNAPEETGPVDAGDFRQHRRRRRSRPCRRSMRSRRTSRPASSSCSSRSRCSSSRRSRTSPGCSWRGRRRAIASWRFDRRLAPGRHGWHSS